MKGLFRTVQQKRYRATEIKAGGQAVSAAVVTPTMDAGTRLEEAIRSVWSLRWNGRLQHVVVGDYADVYGVCELAPKAREHGVDLMVTSLAFPPDMFRAERVARLRNFGVKVSKSDLVAYLDDDNTWDPDHLRTGYSTLIDNPGAGAAYSWRQLMYADGKPWLEERLPWCIDPQRSADRYKLAVENGKMTPGSNVVKDDPNSAVDTNCWMMWRSTAEEYPWPISYTDADKVGHMGEDIALTRSMRDAGVKIVTTELPTVNYILPFDSDDTSGLRVTRSEQQLAAKTSPAGDYGLSSLQR